MLEKSLDLELEKPRRFADRKLGGHDIGWHCQNIMKPKISKLPLGIGDYRLFFNVLEVPFYCFGNQPHILLTIHNYTGTQLVLDLNEWLIVL
jgi:hypothetical protein